MLCCFNSTSVRLNGFRIFRPAGAYSFQFYISTIKCCHEMGNYEKLPCFNSTSVRLNAVGYTYSRHEPQFQFYISTIKYSQAIFGLMIDKFQFYISTIKWGGLKTLAQLNTNELTRAKIRIIS